MVIQSIYQRIRWWKTVDRVGPDIPWTHFLFYFPDIARKFCEKKFARFGKNTEIRPGVYAITCSRISIGDNVVIRPGTVLGADPVHSEGCITIEDDVLMGVGVHIYTTDHEFTDLSKPIIAQGDKPAAAVLIKKGSWIGANAILLPGVTIGEHCVIGAGSIVTKSVPDFSVAAGNPAKVIRGIDPSASAKAEVLNG